MSSANGISSNHFDVSIIVVSWNVAGLLEQCLRSILADSAEMSLEVFVVDNASTDHTVKMVRDKFPWVNLIANTDNVGFARANNQALRRAMGEFVFFLNPDTVLVKGSLKRMIDFMSEHPEVEMTGPRVIFPNAKIQETCARLLPTLLSTLFCDTLRLSKLPVVGPQLARRYRFPYDYRVSQEVQALSGTAILARREALMALDGFGECFVHCGEDVDLCYRFRKQGWTLYYVSEACVIHHHGQSARQVPVRTSVNAALSIERYYARCFGNLQGHLYRFIVQGLQIPALLTIGSVKLLFRIESWQEFRVRLEMARAIWSWRELK